MQTQSRHREAALAPPVRGHPWFAAIYDIVNQSGGGHVLRPFREQIVGGLSARYWRSGLGRAPTSPFTQRWNRSWPPIPTHSCSGGLASGWRRERATSISSCARRRRCPLPMHPSIRSSRPWSSVRWPVRFLAEVRRLLKHGDTFHFIEHVRARGSTGRHRMYSPSSSAGSHWSVI